MSYVFCDGNGEDEDYFDVVKAPVAERLGIGLQNRECGKPPCGFESHRALQSEKQTHKEIRVKCKCGWRWVLTKIQYDEFDCGMMGPLRCPKCKTIMMPSSSREVELEEEVIEVEGEDMGWW